MAFKKTQKILLLSLIIGVVAFFGLASFSVYAQVTGAPGDDEDAINIPNLLRITDPDGNGKQVKHGNLRLGSSTVFDISATLEVFGDLHAQGTLVSSGAGVCDDVVCAYTEGAEQYPTFVAQTDADFVGIGTDNPNSGRMAVLARATENLTNGATYVQSTVDHGVIGVTGAGNKAGLYGIVTNPNMYAVYGKSVDITTNRGITGIGIAGSPAGLFYGNLLITGGFLQGDASLLYRVASINDTSLPATEGGRGIGAWTNVSEVTIGASGSQEIDTGLDESQVIRSIQVLIRKNNGAPESWHILRASDPVDLVVDSGTKKLTFSNTSADTFNIRTIIHVETGVSIAVFHEGNPVANSQAVLFEPSGLYELNAEVSSGLSQSFSWKFTSLTPKGQLCEKIGEGLTGTCLSTSSGTIIGADVYYKIPASYAGDNPPTDSIEVVWQGGVGDIKRLINIQPIHIIPPVNKAIEYNDVSGVDVSAEIKIPATYGSYVEAYTLESPRGTASISAAGVYQAPNIGLDQDLGPLGPEEKIRVTLLGTGISYVYSVWLVPSIVLDTTFPDDLATPLDAPQVGLSTTTTIENKPLDIDSQVSANPYASNAALSCAGGCVEPDILPPVFLTGSLGAQQLVATWTPNAAPYPAGFSYAKSRTIYVGRLTGSGSGTVPRNVVFRVDGWPTTSLNLNSSLNDLAFGTAGANPEIAKSTVLTNGAVAYQNFGTYGETTINSVTTGTTGTHSVLARPLQDMRAVTVVSVTKSGSGCTGCSTSKPPPCCGTVNSQTNGVGL